MTPHRWTKFERADIVDVNPTIAAISERIGMPARDAEVWLNNKYQVQVKRNAPCAVPSTEIIVLSIKRRDKQPIHDWRDLQRIKNEIVGPEHEAVEIYPAESRLVDSANQYWLIVFADPKARLPFGFTERFVSEDCSLNTVQRPFPTDAKPKDLMTAAEYCRKNGIKMS